MKHKYFKLAKRLSARSDYFHKLGAVIVKKNRVLGSGCNKNRTHTRSNNRWRTLHAELAAVLNAGRVDLTGASIYVYREDKRGRPAMAKSCPCCTELLKRAGIKRVYYTTNGSFAECRI